MYLPDVNTLVYAHRPEMAQHAPARRWLEGAIAAREQVVLSDLVIAGFLRLVTNPRVFIQATSLADAVDAVQALLDQAGVERGPSGPGHLPLLVSVAPEGFGDRIPDAFLAAIAIERDATVVTWDRGFGQFRGVRWMTPGRP